jgi:hypothetical protein
MVTIVKHEWHSVDSQYTFDLDESKLMEIYPELSEEEIKDKLEKIESGEISVDDVISDSLEQDVEIEWEHNYDDWYTDRKGGYDVTYDLNEG